MVTGTILDVRAAIAAVPDPELPVVTIAELGILRAVSPRGAGVTVTITPTYSGCPAMATIETDIRAAAQDHGVSDVDIRVVLDPPWSTDDITDEGRGKLAAAGIAPPGPVGTGGPVPVRLGRIGGPDAAVRCPRCGSADTEELSRFAATACLALWRCVACGEPFDRVKEH